MADRYTHGHQDAVLRSHRWRTAENSAAYLLEELGAGDDMLDVGCGPGNITIDLASRVAPGRVIGIDVADEVVDAATAAAAVAGINNVEFETADVYDLPYDTDRFDVVHAHQVLQHLADPAAALAEMRRVLRSDGLLAVRDSDYRAFMWSPGDSRLDGWMQLHHEVADANGADADAGRHLLRLGPRCRIRRCDVLELDMDLRHCTGVLVVGRALGRTRGGFLVRRPGGRARSDRP